MIHQFFLRVDHIGNRENGKIHSVLLAGSRVLRTGARGAGTAANDVGTDDEVFVGVECFAGTDHCVPPAGLFIGFGVVARNMRVTGKRVFDQNCIVAFRREPTVSFITEIDRGEELSALKAQPLFKREIPGRHDSDTVP